MANLTFKQFSGLSCGAACLLVAAKELGVQRFPGNGFGAFSGQEIQLSNGCEREIYRITAKGQEAYSMPQGIAEAAQMMGLDVEVSMSGCMVPKALEWKYPVVRDALEDLGIEIGSGAPTLEENERMLVAVGVGVLGLHWVLYRPDKTYMDPAYASNTSWGLWTMGQLGILRYWDTGIYVVVSYGAVV